jgi:hypothetical protein
MKTRVSVLAMVAGLFIWAACDQGNTDTTNGAPLGPVAVGANILPNIPADGQVDPEEFEICKSGSAATFDYSIEELPSGPTTDGSVTLADGECRVLAAIGGFGANVTVTEQDPVGFDFDNVVFTTLIGGVTTVGAPQTASSTVGPYLIGGTNSGALRGGLAAYTNVAEPPPPAEGRMTGGGNPRIEGVNLGLTLHCDITLSNNLEINWDGGNWHLDKPIQSAVCLDTPVDPTPPASPFDTFIGTAIGRLDRVDGSYAEFTFVDAGEPGRNDTVAIKVWAPGADPSVDTPVLDVAGKLTRGNLQAHYDQPHGNQP